MWYFLSTHGHKEIGRRRRSKRRLLARPSLGCKWEQCGCWRRRWQWRRRWPCTHIEQQVVENLLQVRAIEDQGRQGHLRWWFAALVLQGARPLSLVPVSVRSVNSPRGACLFPGVRDRVRCGDERARQKVPRKLAASSRCCTLVAVCRWHLFFQRAAWESARESEASMQKVQQKRRWVDLWFSFVSHRRRHARARTTPTPTTMTGLVKITLKSGDNEWFCQACFPAPLMTPQIAQVERRNRRDCVVETL